MWADKIVRVAGTSRNDRPSDLQINLQALQIAEQGHGLTEKSVHKDKTIGRKQVGS